MTISRSDDKPRHLLLIHLSDLHIRSDTDPVLERIPEIAPALRSLTESVSGLVIIVTGDIAFSGSEEQFLAGWTALDKLRETLKQDLDKIGDEVNVYVVAIPGNHDLDLSSPDNIRPVLLNNVRQAGLSKPESDNVAGCVRPLAT